MGDRKQVMALPTRDHDPLAPGGTVPSDGPGPAAWIGYHQQAIWRFLRAIGADPERIEDLLQETFLRGLEHGAHRFVEGVSRRWLRTTARNLLFGQWRQEQRRPAIDPLDPEDLVDDVVADEPSLEELQALRECVAGLSERHRLALQMRYGRGVSRAEMAEAFGLSDAGVKMMLRRVRARLKTCVSRRLGGELS